MVDSSWVAFKHSWSWPILSTYQISLKSEELFCGRTSVYVPKLFHKCELSWLSRADMYELISLSMPQTAAVRHASLLSLSFMTTQKAVFHALLIRRVKWLHPHHVKSSLLFRHTPEPTYNESELRSVPAVSNTGSEKWNDDLSILRHLVLPSFTLRIQNAHDIVILTLCTTDTLSHTVAFISTLFTYLNSLITAVRLSTGQTTPDSERTKSKMLLFCIVLINPCTYFHDIWQISVA